VDGNIEPLVNEVAKFPFKYDKSGRCEKLGADNKCMVYETRPDVCVVDKMWEKHTHFISKEQYHKIAESHCKTLQDGL
jgi:Fe-S-cluster containining protein